MATEKRPASDAPEETTEPVATSKRQRRMGPAPVMRLHIVRRESDVLTADAVRPRDLEQLQLGGLGLGGGGCGEAAAGAAMDETLWRKLPEEILWKVMLLVPAAKRFQFQAVSRKWRQELTSAHFIKAVMAREGQRGGGPTQRQVACVRSGEKGGILVVPPAGEGSGAGEGSTVVDIDLGFVPREFWANTVGRYFSAVAAADGLVCVSDTGRYVGCKTRLCVVNPLTRTCRVLPRLPFPPALAAPVELQVMVHLQAGVVAALCKFIGHSRVDRVPWRWALATYDLETRGGQWIHTPGPAPAPGPVALLTHRPRRLYRWWPWLAGHFVTCMGRSYCYYDRKIYVHAVSRGAEEASAGEMVEAWQIASPGTAWDPRNPAAAATTMAYPGELVTMLVHQDTLYLVAMVESPPQPRSRTVPEAQSFRIWELQQHDSTYTWRQLAALGRHALDWLTGFRYTRCPVLVVRSACAAGGPRELQLGFEIVVVVPGGLRGRELGVMVAFSVPDKRWDLVHNHSELTGARAFHLSPNYYLM